MVRQAVAMTMNVHSQWRSRDEVLISPIHFSVLLDTLKLSGHDSRAIASRCDLDDQAFDPLSTWLPLAKFDRLMVECQNMTGDQGYGISAALSPAVLKHGDIAMLLMHGPDLERALVDLLRYAALYTPSPEIRVMKAARSGETGLQFHPLHVGPDARRFRAEMLVVGLVLVLRYYGLSNLDIRRITFDFPRPSYADRYLAILGCEAIFEEDSISIYFASDRLRSQRADFQESLYLQTRRKLEQAWETKFFGNDFSNTVRLKIQATLTQQPTLADMAGLLGLSEKAFRTKLRKAGIDYAELKTDVLRQRSKELLMEDGMSVKRVAGDLGFSESSSFCRAFKKWHGLSPTDWMSVHGSVEPGGMV